MSEPSSPPPTCENCRFWDKQGDGWMQHRCQEPDNLLDRGEHMRAVWETCPRWKPACRSADHAAGEAGSRTG